MIVTYLSILGSENHIQNNRGHSHSHYTESEIEFSLDEGDTTVEESRRKDLASCFKV